MIGLTIAMLEANVAQSRGHIVKQEAIIARLVGQGHVSTTADARALLTTMHAHLATEIDMLAQAQREQGGG